MTDARVPLHLNLYYIFKEDKERHSLPPDKAAALLKKIMEKVLPPI